MINFFKNSFTHLELEQISKNNPSSLSKLKWICDNLFSNKILEIIFTENATKYSKDNFADHFYNIFLKQITWYFSTNPKNSNIGSILFNNDPINYQLKINKKSSVDYYHGDFLSYLSQTNKTFDLIDLSNISDWMPLNNMEKILSTSFSKLNKNGVIVGRKLLGDYSWAELQKKLIPSLFLPFDDHTMFYQECVFIKKIA
ncbi:hypothetical protein GW796_08100 [archaeon]|nr:hypothetical protein [archaeon]